MGSSLVRLEFVAMASAQLGEKEKAVMEEGMKDAKNFIMTNNISNNQIQAMAVVSIRSSFGQRMRSYRNHSWIGTFMARLPEFINGGDGAVFAHKGSKAALLYGLDLDASPLALGWILAWSKPDTPGEPNRVYVQGGLLEKLLKTDWSEIEQKLDKSSDYSQHWDTESGATLTARISDDSEKVAIVNSTFSINSPGGP